MRQRLGTAMALLAVLPLIVWDEPTDRLDPAETAEITQALIVTLAVREGRRVSPTSPSEIGQMNTKSPVSSAPGELRYQGPLCRLLTTASSG